MTCFTSTILFARTSSACARSPRAGTWLKPCRATFSRISQEIVDRFQRHSGIHGEVRLGRTPGRSFDTGIATVSSRAWSTKRLVNVRKHSGAHRVIVRSTRGRQARGLSRSRTTAAASRLAAARHKRNSIRHREGPRTVIERARRLGAEVAVESRPGCGSRVEIVLRLPVE